jgi:hypothetical protein
MHKINFHITIRKTRKEYLRLLQFINDGSVCQVHAPDETRTKIMKESVREEIPNTIFDAALAALIEDMHVNSYRQYCSLSEVSNVTEVSPLESSEYQAVSSEYPIPPDDQVV